MYVSEDEYDVRKQVREEKELYLRLRQECEYWFI